MTVFAAVTSMLETYFDGLYPADIQMLGRVFHPKAIYATADETPFLHRTMEEYFPVVAKRVSPASRDEPRRDVVEGIQFAGDNTAFGRLRSSIGTKDFIDFLTIVRTNDEWKILAKIFHMKERES